MFDANRDIRIDATETSEGIYTLVTRGLKKQRRPELEIIAVPAGALHAAAGILNTAASYTVNQAPAKAGERLGFVLAVDGDEPLLLAVKAFESVPGASGVMGWLLGHGVLRLVDPLGDDPSAPPLTALATMLLHRARASVAQRDAERARAELGASLAVFPGEPKASETAAFDASAPYNFENHLSYLALSELTADEDEAMRLWAAGLARHRARFENELLGDPEAVAAVGESEAIDLARAVVRTNLGDPKIQPGPTDALRIVASPIWCRAASGKSGRPAAIVPASFVDHYYGGAAREALAGADDVPRLAARILRAHQGKLPELAFRVRSVKSLYLGGEGPYADLVEPGHEAVGILSAVVADVARCLRAGCSLEEAGARFGLEAADGAKDAARRKVADLESWEADELASAPAS